MSDDIKQRLLDESFKGQEAMRREALARIEALEAELAEADATIDAFGKVAPQQYQKELAEATAHGKCGWEKAAALRAQLAAAREALESIAARKVIRHGDHIRCHVCGYKSVLPHVEERHAPNCARQIALAAPGKDTQ